VIPKKVLERTISELEGTRFRIETNSGEGFDTLVMVWVVVGIVHETVLEETRDWLPQEWEVKESGVTECSYRAKVSF